MPRFRPGELAPGSRSSRDPRSAGKDAGTAMLIGPMDMAGSSMTRGDWLPAAADPRFLPRKLTLAFKN